MEAQLHRPQDTGLHSGEGQGQVHDEGEQHPKQSVLRKVKAKAKKIKDHLKHGLGHEHGHEHEHEHEQHSLQGDEEEENDDEEMEEGAEVHGGPYAIRSKDIPKEEVVPMGNLENPTSPKEDPYDSKMKNEDVHRPILQRQDEFARPPSLEGTHFPEEGHQPPFAETHETKGIDDNGTSLGKHEHQGLQGHENIGAPTGLMDHHAAHRPVTAAETRETKGFDHGTAPGEQGYQELQGHENIIGAPTGLVDHHAAAAHRPITTAAETHETEGFGHVAAPGAKGHQGLQGHENIVGAPTDLANPHASHLHEQMHRPPAVADTGVRGELNDQGLQGHKYKVLTGLEGDPNVPKDHPEPTNYQSKVTDPTGANNEEAGVSPLVQSFEKMGVKDDVPEATGIRTEPRAEDFQFDQGTEHSQYTGSHDQFAPQESPTVFPSVREDTESIPKSMNPSNPEDLPQDTLTGKPGSYTQKISSATSAIADKAVAAKNVVASKLGYGGTEEEPRDTQVTGGGKDATKATSATALAQKYASTVTGKLAPVYEKVAGAGSAVMAKVQGTATGVTGHENRGGVDAEHEVKSDKGVSMKEYFAEKFKPGEEDRALSEVISGSLSRQKDKTEETGEVKPMGKVTESVEVERRLGPIEPTNKEEDGASGETKGQGVVDRVKGAVSTWLGKGVEAQANDSAAGGGAVVGGTG